MKGFALYRMPYAGDSNATFSKGDCTLLSGEVLEVSSCNELNTLQGFVMAPFVQSSEMATPHSQREKPILVIRADSLSSVKEDEVCSLLQEVQLDASPSVTTKNACHTSTLRSKNYRADYHIDFLNFHAHLLNDNFQKLVLSRCVEVEREEKTDPVELFQRASRRYPRMFIALVYTEQSGLWLAATPEVLLTGDGQQWKTVALAGTMAWADCNATLSQWSEKDVQEQRYVATYIAEQLGKFTKEFSEEGPQTVRAGHLAHLRSDFNFTFLENANAGQLIEAMHPTPAVCGLPKKDALRFILQNEHHDRSYYSGFMGPMGVEGQTALFVTLRCMRIYENAYRLYAGGGLLKGSVEEQEWQETEAKLDTMRNIIYNV